MGDYGRPYENYEEELNWSYINSQKKIASEGNTNTTLDSTHPGVCRYTNLFFVCV